MKIRQRLPWCATHLGAVADAAFAVDEAAFASPSPPLAAPDAHASPFRQCSTHVLHHHEVELVENAVDLVLIKSAGRSDWWPQTKAPSPCLSCSFEDLIIGQTGLVGNALRRNAQSQWRLFHDAEDCGKSRSHQEDSWCWKTGVSPWHCTGP